MPASAPAAYCRVTVLAPGRRVDVALPADVPLAEVVPLVLELLGAPRPGGRADPWRFTGATGGPLPPEATLDELGVLDGELLRIGPAVPPPAPPVFDDPVEAVATLVGREGPAVGPAPVAVAVLAVAAAALLAAVPGGALPAAVPGGAGPYVPGAVALGLAVTVLALVFAARVARRPADPPTDRSADPTTAPDRTAPDRTGAVPGAALLSAGCAVPFAAATGWVALPAPVGPAHLLLAVVAAGLAAAAGQAAVRAVAPPLVAVVVVAVLAAAAATVRLRFGVAPAAVAAITAAVALAAGPLLPRAVLRLAGLPRPVVAGDAAGLVAADAGPAPPADELAERARTARGQLSGLVGGCAVAAATAAVTAAVTAATAGAGPADHPAPGWTTPVLACVVVAVLLLRARTFADPGPARVHRAAGTAGAVALVGLGAAVSGPAGRLAAALALTATAVAVAAARDRRTSPSPVVRRGLAVAEGVLTAAALPLALAAAGVLAAVRGL